MFPVGDAETATLKIRPGDTKHFTLGEGAPVFPERDMVSGLAVNVHVFEADGNVRKAGEVIEKAADAVKTDGNLAKVLKKLIENPGGVAAGTDLVLGAAAEAAKVVAEILERESQRERCVLHRLLVGCRQLERQAERRRARRVDHVRRVAAACVGRRTGARHCVLAVAGARTAVPRGAPSTRRRTDRVTRGRARRPPRRGPRGPARLDLDPSWLKPNFVATSAAPRRQRHIVLHGADTDN